MNQLNPYLSFNGKCREAMTFYKECLGGELMLVPVEGSPAAEHMPAEARDQILHASLTNGPLSLMGTDCGPAPAGGGDSCVSLSLNSDNEDDIRRFFSGLARGGTVHQPLGEQFWGDLFGQLTDRYGFNWMLNCHKSSQA